MAKTSRTPTGLASDSSGGPVIDPTANVQALVEAGLKRQDDLRALEATHVREVMQLRSEFNNEIRHENNERLKAQRDVDQGQLVRAAETQLTTANTLAAQVATAAVTLRAQVDSSQTQSVAQFNAALDPISKRVEELSRVQFAQQGERAAQSDSRIDKRDGRDSNQFILTTIIASAGCLIAFVAMLVAAAGVALLFATGHVR